MDLPRSIRSVVEVTHTVHPGVFDGMANCLVARYLIPRARHLTMIEYPFEEKRSSPVRRSEYSRGAVLEEKEYCRLNGPAPILFLRDFLLTISLLLSRRQKYDFFIGVDSLNACAGLVLKMLGRVSQVCFYSIDYSPKRFSNPILSSLYRFLEIAATKKSDFVWCCSEQIKAVRIEQGCSPQRCLVVSPGLLPEGIPPSSPDACPKLVYFGRLTQGKGIELAIRAMTVIKESILDCQLWIIGDGPQRRELEELSRSLGLVEVVKFWGFLSDYDYAAHLVSQCDVGLACYDSHFDYEPYAFPGKVAQYLGMGLPVIMTEIRPYSDHLRDAAAGFVIGYDSRELSDVVIRLLSSVESYESHSGRARILAQRYDVEKGLALALDVVGRAADTR
jgi:glycosyltransferase involved in cell wall biosynthesis